VTEDQPLSPPIHLSGIAPSEMLMVMAALAKRVSTLRIEVSRYKDAGMGNVANGARTAGLLGMRV
jgi:hypothetical protein